MGRNRLGFRIMNHSIHLIVPVAARVGEDDQFAQETERENLHAEHDEQRCQQQCRAIGQGAGEQHSIEYQV